MSDKQNMQTVLISAGNSDDKMTQREWSAMCTELISIAHAFGVRYLGDWYSAPAAPYQNMCVAFDMSAAPHAIDGLYVVLEPVREKYRQDAIAVLAGTTTFVGSWG
jgi:hypothetical protein